MKRTLMIGLGWLAAAACLSHGRADALVSYDLKGQDGTQVATEPCQVASHLEASAIIRGKAYLTGVKIGLSKDGMAFVPQAADDPSAFLEPYSISKAEQHGAYFEITLTPEEGYSFSVKSVLFGTRRASRRSGPNYMEVRSSLDGFRMPIASDFDTVGLGGNDSLDLSIDLGRALFNLHTPVTLRFYGYGRGVTTDQRGIWVISNPTSGFAVVEGEIRKATP